MSTNPLIGSKSKIKWAKDHIRDIDKAIRAYEAAGPHALTVHVNVEGTEEVVKLAIKPIPAEIGVMTGNVIYNFRSSLDLLTCALAVQNGHTKVRDVYFPFANNNSEFAESNCQRKIHRLSPEAKDMIAALKPYKGGNDTLWALNRLGNTDRHVALIDVMLPLLGAAIHAKSGAFTPIPNQPALADGAVVYSGTPGSHKDRHFELWRSVSITFGEVDIVKGRPVVDTLHQFSDLVEGILLNFEARFF